MALDTPADPAARPPRLSYQNAVILFILASVLVRWFIAAVLPLAFDETLYWRYSKHLAAGYIDHPFMNPLMIRIGTTLFGDTPLGVRFMAVLLGLPASWAVWQASLSLFRDRRIAATSALFYNLTLVMSVGSLLATSDQIVVTTSCFLLLALAKLNETGKGQWWLAIGAAFGLGLCSKYTTVFFGLSIAAWLLLVRERRAWFLSPWPWAGAAVAVATFAPVLAWNADHHWASLVYQSGRIGAPKLTLRFALELIVALAFLAMPPVFILGAIGMTRSLGAQSPFRAERILLLALILPLILYFFWHSLHERVQANWPEPVFPAFIILAAYAAVSLHGQTGVAARWTKGALAWAVPLSVALTAVIYVQGTTGAIPISKRDPLARVLGVGWVELGQEIEAARLSVGARTIVTSDYTLAGQIKFYLPPGTVVEQLTQRVRWANEPPVDAALFNAPALYVCRKTCGQLDEARQRFRSVELLGVLTRDRNGRKIGDYRLYKLTGAIPPVLASPDDIPKAGASQ